ncbi:uncharacterized protein LOC134865013 [Eleginops maclovinus]|uniref:uncharacterized protein LOC134865013 n=1 Tax=Eleginops maclovinus TaxID=56733 RepID=UPI0030805F46
MLLSFSGYRRLFCKGKCEEGNILVETTDDTVQRGRYSIRYEEGFYPAYSTILYVSITKLTKSDEGGYRCGLDRSLPASDSHKDFRITVKEAPTSSKPEVTPRPFSTSAPSTSTLTTTQSLSSTPSSASPERTTPPHQGTTAPAAGHGVVLFVRLFLVVVIIVISASVLIFCKRRARKPRETAEEAEYVNVTEANRVCEEVREEDRGSGSSPVEMSVLSPSHSSQFTEEN